MYELAKDLSPSIVFIEDIDLVGQERGESRYTGGEALSELLSALDGVEECRNVVTVATTNWLEIIDKRLSERPYLRQMEVTSTSASEHRTAIVVMERCLGNSASMTNTVWLRFRNSCQPQPCHVKSSTGGQDG